MSRECREVSWKKYWNKVGTLVLHTIINIFEKISGYVGFLPPPTYFLPTLLGLLHAIVNNHSVYVGSMWVGVRIHSFFRKCFYYFEDIFWYIHMHIHLIKVGCRHSMYRRSG